MKRTSRDLPELHRHEVGGRTVLRTDAASESRPGGEVYEGPYWSRLLAGLDPDLVDPDLAIPHLSVADDARQVVDGLAVRIGVPLIVLYGSDESGVPLEVTAPNVVAVGQTYAGAAVLRRGHVALPPGAMGGRFHEQTPMSDRDIDVVFLGVLNRRRAAILGSLGRLTSPSTWLLRAAGRSTSSTTALARVRGRLLSRARTGPRLRVGRTNVARHSARWAGGLAADEYRDLLGRARVAICPPGWTSNETFRHFEAASAGCRIVTAPLPRSWLYRDHPFHVAESPGDWLVATRSALQASTDPAMTASATRRFWEARLSPEAAARHLSAELAEALRRHPGFGGSNLAQRGAGS